MGSNAALSMYRAGAASGCAASARMLAEELTYRDQARGRRRALAQTDAYRLRRADERARRRIGVSQRTPPWSGELDELVMLEAHDLARRRGIVTGFAWEVDHIIPLHGRVVSGLHVWNNVRVISATANATKSNGFRLCGSPL
jgi:hypothetical protein